MTYFFDYPHNFNSDTARNLAGTNRLKTAVLTDGRTDTYLTETTYRFLTQQPYRDADSDAAVALRTSHIFVRSQGVASYAVSVPAGFGTGTAFTRTVPETIANPQGQQIPITRNGIQNDLVALTAPITASAIDITFTGTSISIYEVMLLNLRLSLNAESQFIKIEPTRIDRGSDFHETQNGRLLRYTTADSHKWRVAFGARFAWQQSYDELLHFMETHREFTFAQEYNRYPNRLFPAVFTNQEVTLAFLSRYKGSGTDMYFEIAEM